MNQRHFTLVFVSVCAVAAATASVAIALGLIRLINWTFQNCGTSSACNAATWVIAYWWALFVPVCVIAAVLLRRLHDAMRAGLSTPKSS